MKVTFSDGLLIATPESPEEARSISASPWVTPYQSSYLLAWTRLAQLHQAFRLDISREDLERLGQLNRITHTLTESDPTEREMQAVTRWFHPDYQPRSYQVQGIVHLMRQEKAMLADDTGLGKTLQSAGAVLLRQIVDPTEGSVVIVCPAGLRYQWRLELERMFVRPGTEDPIVLRDDVDVVDGPPGHRRRLYGRQPQPWVIVNYELLLRDRQRIWSWLDRSNVCAVILDESSRYRNPRSKTFEVVCDLLGRYQPRLCYALNATPIENNLEDLWAQLRSVTPAIFPDFYAYDARYIRRITIKPKAGGRQFSKITGYQNLSELRQLIRGSYVRRTYEDVDEQLPDVLVSRVAVELGSEQRQAYEDLKNDPELKDLVSRYNALVYCALWSESEDGKKHYSAKLDVLQDVLTTIGEDKVLLVSQSKRFCKRVAVYIEKHFGKCGAIHGDVTAQQRAKTERNFQSGSLQYIVGTSAMERGLNLQSAGWVVNMDLPWNPAALRQRVGRARRIGATHSTIKVVNLIAVDTVDQQVEEVAYEKNRSSQSIFRAETELPQIHFRRLVRAI